MTIRPTRAMIENTQSGRAVTLPVAVAWLVLLAAIVAAMIELGW